jgi:hypothetical protein
MEHLLRTARDWQPETDAPEGIAHRALAGKGITSSKASRMPLPPLWWQVGGTVSVGALAAASVWFVQLSGGVPVEMPQAAPEIRTASQEVATIPTKATPPIRFKPTAGNASVATSHSGMPSVTKPVTIAAEAPSHPRRSRTHPFHNSGRRNRQMIAERGSESSSSLSGAAAAPKEATPKPAPAPMWKTVAVQRPVYGMLAPAVLTTTNEQGETEEMPVVLDVALNAPPSPDNFGE